MSENINDVFRTVQAETLCPFAKSAVITFARPIAAETSLSEAAQQLHEDFTVYAQYGIATAPDGLAVSVHNTFIGDDFESLTSGFNALYRALKVNDGLSEEALAAENVEDSDWRLVIAGQRFFSIVFSSLYSSNNPRYIPDTNTTFILFQPLESFGSRLPFGKDGKEFRRVKEGVRSRFAQAGRAYDGAINDDPREAAKYLTPLHLGAQAIEWWKSE